MIDMNHTILKTHSKAGILQSRMHKHLAIFSDSAAQSIFNGSKLIEGRFSQKRIAPFGVVHSGDVVYIKPPGKEITGQFSVGKVISFENMQNEEWELIKNYFWPRISLGSQNLDEEFLHNHQLAKFGTLIFIERVEQFITSPLKFKKTDQRGWVVLD